METKNIKFVAYLRFIGVHPDQIKRITKGKAAYLFHMEQSQWVKLKQDFDRSDFIKYGQCIDAIIDLAH